MKNIYFTLIAFCFGIAAKAQIINFTDPHFKAALLEAQSTGSTQFAGFNTSSVYRIDSNYDYEIDVEEALRVTSLNIHPNLVTSLGGIEYFTNLQSFLFWSNNQYSHTDIDIHALSNLTQFMFSGGNQTGTLNVTGMANLTDLTVRGTLLPSLDLHGLTSLQSLSLTENCGLTAIDITPATNLAFMTLLGNPLTSINLNGNPNLQHVWVSGSLITTVDVSGLPLLTNLNVEDNQITSLNLVGAEVLNTLSCSQNQLTTLNVSANPLLWSLRCEENQLTQLDLSHNTLLGSFSCEDNQITDLDLSHSNFRNIFCGSNNLVSLNIKNNNYDCEVFMNHGQTYGRLDFSNNPNLRYICLDEVEESYVQGKITQYGYTNCHTNGYCSFNPGGTFYTIAGNAKYDFDANGCDQSDTAFPYLEFNITNGTASGNLIASASGNYTIPVQAGAHTITPILEHPEYFTVLPPSVTVDFPAETSPYQQNFCITANAIHSDAEVNIIPTTAARPGFDATYKIRYKNNGNQTLSGAVSFAYNASVLHFTNSSVAPSSQPMNYINWDFTGLQPFETREIFVTFTVNSAVDMPPVDSGFVLTYTLCINTGANEETPADNIFVLNQTVVNSIDPNDKVCLEGNSITPDLIGKYVHYIIRFENTGTANAENIVVKDVIDTTKFDINSLVPIDGSHAFVTKISNTNKVEFIFENINLPFDDANNDGYIAFKIKTLPTLSIGDSFSNSAGIYFDYNAPVTTEPAVTTIHNLLASDVFDSEAFAVTPNPAATTINISNVATRFDVQITSILGGIVLQKSNSNTIDVSDLASGVYLVTIKQGDKSSTQKFVKN